jgi:hypothetical protein
MLALIHCHPLVVPSGAPRVNVGLESNCAVHPSTTHVVPALRHPVTGRAPSSQTCAPGADWIVTRLPAGTVTFSL